MTEKIILNLDAPEYHDAFNPGATQSNERELWQVQANSKLIENLIRMGFDSRKYKEHLKQNNYARLTSYHHAIFISGARGAGKTVFCVTLKPYGMIIGKNSQVVQNYILLM